MDIELLSFTKVKPPTNLIDEIWSFNVKTMESITDITLVEYITALAQWLVYYKSQVNMTKAEMVSRQNDIEFLVATWMTKEILKEYKTQTAARDYLIRNNPESLSMNDKVQELKQGLIKVEGMDKAITEYINAFKRELDRRKHEREVVRRERRI